MVLSIAEVHISEGLNDLPMDTTRTNSGCTTGINDQLDTFMTYTEDQSDQAMWHYIDHCRPGAGFSGSYTAGLAYIGQLCSNGNNANIGVTYTSSDSSDTWLIFAHEVGHNLAATHPFGSDANKQGTYGGIMDYGNNFAVQADSTSMEAFNTAETKSTICNHIDSKLGTAACTGHIDRISTATPTAAPTTAPTAAPTASPTAAPTATPTATPTASPTATPTATPTAAPTAAPTPAPTPAPVVTSNAETVTAGATVIALADITGINVGDTLTISDGTNSETSEVTAVTADLRRQRRATSGTVTCADAFVNSYAASSTVTATAAPTPEPSDSGSGSFYSGEEEEP